MLIESGGVEIKKTIWIQEPNMQADRPAKSAGVSIRVVWPEHESPSAAMFIDSLQRAIIAALPTAYQELEARLTPKENPSA